MSGWLHWDTWQLYERDGVFGAADCRLDAVILMSSGVFKPYAGVPTKKDWFYYIEADEFSLGDKRTFTDGMGDMLHYSSNHVPTS